MPKFYCEYCSIYLTHSSPAGRKQHSQGRKHINAKVDYYQKLVRERFFQPPPFLNHQMPMFGVLPMMGMMPGFPGLQPGNMVQKLDSNQPFLPPQGMMPPFPGPLPGTLPPPMPGHMLGPVPPPPMPGGVPPHIPGVMPGAPGVPTIPSELPKLPTDLNPLHPLPMSSGQRTQNDLSHH